MERPSFGDCVRRGLSRLRQLPNDIETTPIRPQFGEASPTKDPTIEGVLHRLLSTVNRISSAMPGRHT